MRGRKSEKKETLLRTYRFLRAMMTQDDVQQLKKDCPSFVEITELNKDAEVQAANELLVDIMIKVSPPDWDGRELL